MLNIYRINTASFRQHLKAKYVISDCRLIPVNNQLYFAETNRIVKLVEVIITRVRTEDSKVKFFLQLVVVYHQLT